jgi:hypothetical protein
MSQFKKYPKIYALGSEENSEFFDFAEDTVVIEEKVDGGNFLLWLDEGDNKIHVGSRNRDLTSEQDEKTFAKQRATLMDKLKDKKLNPDYIYYLECMAPHTIRYKSAPDVIGIDIRS